MLDPRECDSPVPDETQARGAARTPVSGEAHELLAAIRSGQFNGESIRPDEFSPGGASTWHDDARESEADTAVQDGFLEKLREQQREATARKESAELERAQAFDRTSQITTVGEDETDALLASYLERNVKPPERRRLQSSGGAVIGVLKPKAKRASARRRDPRQD